MKLTVNFGKYAHCLWDSQMANFIKEQKGRFVLLEGKEILRGELFFCERYIEAKFTQAYLDKKYRTKTALYSDESGGFAVALNKMTKPYLHKINK